MLVKIFTLRFNPLIGGFDDEPVQRFLQDKSVIKVSQHDLTLGVAID